MFQNGQTFAYEIISNEEDSFFDEIVFKEIEYLYQLF